MLLGWFLQAFVAVPMTVSSGSMAPTLRVGDRILVDRLSRHLGGVDRGDVIAFTGSESFGRPGQTYVKRVIAVGGDRVACCDARGRLTVDGEPLAERRYLWPEDRPSALRFDVEVPAGRLWVMGDHRSASRDSRAFLGAPGGGTVAVDDVVGRVVGVTWPVSRFGDIGS